MSNVCDNRIEIIGDKDVITRLFELVKSEERDWGYMGSGDSSLKFDFNKVVPYPEEFAKLDAERERQESSGVPFGELPESGYSKGGREWQDEYWGTRGNPMNADSWFAGINAAERFDLSEFQKPACGVIVYSTAWSPALAVTAALSKMYPELIFTHSYSIEGGGEGSGYQVWKAGNLLEEHEDDIEDYEQEGDYEE
jgi:hypothetical protein